MMKHTIKSRKCYDTTNVINCFTEKNILSVKQSEISYNIQNSTYSLTQYQQVFVCLSLYIA